MVEVVMVRSLSSMVSLRLQQCSEHGGDQQGGKQGTGHKCGPYILLPLGGGGLGGGLRYGGGAGLDGPVGGDGGVGGEHGGGGHLTAAHRLGVPAVKGVTRHGRLLGRALQFAGQVRVGDHGRADAALGIHTNGVHVLFLFAR